MSKSGKGLPPSANLEAATRSGDGDEASRELAARDAPASAPGSVTRRTALKVIATAATLPALAAEACVSGPETAVRPSNPLARGTPADPDLVDPSVPWERVLTEDELRTVRALCDVILPADDRSPSAGSVGVPEFIDEWIAAPYPANLRDQVRIRGGLVWLNTEAHERFGSGFADLELARQHAICDDICHVEDASPELRPAARFFDRFRDLTASGFWTTAEGMADLQYLGNVPTASWDGPPAAVLERLGLA